MNARMRIAGAAVLALLLSGCTRWVGVDNPPAAPVPDDVRAWSAPMACPTRASLYGLAEGGDAIPVFRMTRQTPVDHFVLCTVGSPSDTHPGQTLRESMLPDADHAVRGALMLPNETRMRADGACPARGEVPVMLLAVVANHSVRVEIPQDVCHVRLPLAWEAIARAPQTATRTITLTDAG